MEIKTIITVVIAGMLGALVFGVMLPIFAETTSADTTFTNEGLPYIRATAEDNYRLVWDPATPEKATVNEEEYIIWKTGDGTKNISLIMIPDKGIIRYNMGSNGVLNSNQVVGLGTLNATNGFTFSYSNGTYTITNESQTITGTSTEIYAIGNGGNYVLKNPTDRSYLVENSEIFGMGVTNVIAWNNGFQIEGDNFQIDGEIDNIEVSTFSTGTATFTITNVADDLQMVNGYNGLYTLNKATFTTTGTPAEGDPVTVNATYNYFLVPAEVTAEKTNHPNGATTALMNLLPILIGIGLVIGIAGVVLARRF